MSDLPAERIYCAEQINIPPTFPRILKVYVKSAIRTQPRDLLRWTAAYFRALANGEPPPAKDRLEYPPFTHPTGITPGYLKTLLRRFGHANRKIRHRDLLLEWRGLDLPEATLYQLFTAGDLSPDNGSRCDLYRFLAVACGFLGNNLFETMVYVCELLTHEPEGGSATIPLRIFLNLYGYLADLDCGGERHREVVGAASSVPKPSSGAPIDPTAGGARSCEFAATVKEAKSIGGDICGTASSREKPPSESLEILKDYRDDPKHVVAPVRQPVAGDKTEIEIESIDRHIFRRGKSEPAIGANTNVDGPFGSIDHTGHYDDTHEGLSGRDTDVRRTADDAFEFNSECETRSETEMMGEAETIDDGTAGASIDLEGSRDEICRCSGVPESCRTPPSPDPMAEFLGRMRAEVEAGRLQTVFRVPGIGPPVSAARVTAVGLWLTDCARRQEGMVGPRNIRHFLCPNLDDISES